MAEKFGPIICPSRGAQPRFIASVINPISAVLYHSTRPRNCLNLSLHRIHNISSLLVDPRSFYPLMSFEPGWFDPMSVYYVWHRSITIKIQHQMSSNFPKGVTCILRCITRQRERMRVTPLGFCLRVSANEKPLHLEKTTSSCY